VTVGRPGAELAPGSFRPSAPVQASLREDAEHFANDPANWPTYKGDIAHLCAKCDVYHLSKPEWLEPGLTHQDAALLASMGVAIPEKMPGDLRCAQCHVLFRAGIDFLILPDGRMVCETD